MQPLMHLPDEVLLNIFCYLTHKDLSNLSQTCSRFWRLSRYKALWEYIDLSNISLNLDRFRKAMRLFPPSLKTLTIRGFAKPGSPRWKTETLSRAVLSKLALRCPTVHTIHLIEVYFPEKTKLAHFPSSLRSISLTTCQFASSTTWFSSKIPPQNLRHVNLIECSGISQRALLAISKWQNLESLSLENCYNITDNMLVHVTAGLKNLKSLDLRGTDTSDMIVIHIGLEMKNLKELKIGGRPGHHTCITRNLISDGGVLCLEEIAKNLLVLDLSSTSITNDSLVFIQVTCPSLRQLIVKNTEITIDAINTLKSKLPNCQVTWQ